MRLESQERVHNDFHENEYMKRSLSYLTLLIGLISSCISPEKEDSFAADIENPTNHVIVSSEIVWEQLNPARGDQSPQAGTIWGDRKGTEATGFLAKFVDGFSSPPHIHNVTYRAVVIEGVVHNDDPQAANMWMKPGSFWTQPAGEPHITSAKGKDVLALVEIDNGPYLVKPIEEAQETGESPINVDVSNLVWLDNDQSKWIDSNSKAEISFLLEKDQLRSLFVKLPNGFDGEIKTNGETMHSVVIQGELNYTMPINKTIKTLTAGSYFGSSDQSTHTVLNHSEQEVIIYIRTNGEVIIK